MKQIIFIIIMSFAYNNISAQVYSYPIKPGTEAWKKLKSHDDMVNICQIPDNLIQQMNTRDLLETCLKYPLFFDMYAYDNPKIGFDEMSKNFNGFLSLKKRSDACLIILEEYKRINAESVATFKSEEEKGKFTMHLSAIEILIANDDILNQLKQTHKKEILKEILRKNQGKEEYKDIFGKLGKLTLVYTASKILDTMDDTVWKSYKEGNQNAKLFSDKMILSDQSILNNVLLNVQRILNK